MRPKPGPGEGPNLCSVRGEEEKDRGSEREGIECGLLVVMRCRVSWIRVKGLGFQGNARDEVDPTLNPMTLVVAPSTLLIYTSQNPFMNG